MFDSLKHNWRGRPGHRFQARFDRRTRKDASVLAHAVNITLALASFAVGVVLVVLPGPAILFFFISATLLATESRVIAALLDRLELKLRAGFGWSRRAWAKLALGGKFACCGIAAAMGAGVCFAAYRLLFVA
jgi:hypothetical protein